MIGMDFLNNTSPDGESTADNINEFFSTQIPTTDNVVSGLWDKFKNAIKSFLPTNLYNDLFPTIYFGVESPESIRTKRTKQFIIIGGIVLLYKYCLPRKYQII